MLAVKSVTDCYYSSVKKLNSFFFYVDIFTISTFDVDPSTLAGRWVDVAQCKLEKGNLLGKGGLRGCFDAIIKLDTAIPHKKHKEVFKEPVVVKKFLKKTVDTLKRDHVYLCRKVGSWHYTITTRVSSHHAFPA